MKENKYDDPQFFEKYSHMARSEQGLEGAGEWYALQKMLPDFSGKRVLDLGCGYGWHCRYAARQGAARVLGLDLSEKMLERARQMTQEPNIHYCRRAIEDIDFPPASFDLVLSSLAFHYIVWRLAAISSFPWSIRSLRPMGTRIGITAARERSSTGRWTTTTKKGAGRRCSWGSR